MAHFAELNNENKVLRVVVINNSDCLENGIENEETGILFCKSLFGENTRWIQTSYNARFRAIYAGPGDYYNEETNEFESEIITEE